MSKKIVRNIIELRNKLTDLIEFDIHEIQNQVKC